jgi:hypothetical protein
MALRSTQQFINEHHNEGLSITALLRLATRVRRLYYQPRHAQNRGMCSALVIRTQLDRRGLRNKRQSWEFSDIDNPEPAVDNSSSLL